MAQARLWVNLSRQLPPLPHPSEEALNSYNLPLLEVCSLKHMFIGAQVWERGYLCAFSISRTSDLTTWPVFYHSSRDCLALPLTLVARCQGNKALSFPVLCRISAPISAGSTSTQRYLVIVTVSAKGWISPARTGRRWFQKSRAARRHRALLASRVQQD